MKVLIFLLFSGAILAQNCAPMLLELDAKKILEDEKEGSFFATIIHSTFSESFTRDLITIDPSRLSFIEIRDLIFSKHFSHDFESRGVTGQTQISSYTEKVLVDKKIDTVLNELRSLAGTIKNTEQLKGLNYYTKLWSDITKTLKKKNKVDFYYNKDKTNLFDVLDNNELQCNSGTLLYHLVTYKNNDHNSKNSAQDLVMFSSNHVQTAIIENGNLYKLEHTLIAPKVKAMGSLNLLSKTFKIPVRLITREDFIYMHLFQSYFSKKINLNKVFESMKCHASKLVGSKAIIDQFELNIQKQKSSAVSSSISGKLNSSPFALSFEKDETPAGFFKMDVDSDDRSRPNYGKESKEISYLISEETFLDNKEFLFKIKRNHSIQENFISIYTRLKKIYQGTFLKFSEEKKKKQSINFVNFINKVFGTLPCYEESNLKNHCFKRVEVGEAKFNPYNLGRYFSNHRLASFFHLLYSYNIYLENEFVVIGGSNRFRIPIKVFESYLNRSFFSIPNQIVAGVSDFFFESRVTDFEDENKWINSITKVESLSGNKVQVISDKLNQSLLKIDILGKESDELSRLIISNPTSFGDKLSGIIKKAKALGFSKVICMPLTLKNLEMFYLREDILIRNSDCSEPKLAQYGVYKLIVNPFLEQKIRDLLQNNVQFPKIEELFDVEKVYGQSMWTERSYVFISNLAQQKSFFLENFFSLISNPNQDKEGEKVLKELREKLTLAPMYFEDDCSFSSGQNEELLTLKLKEGGLKSSQYLYFCFEQIASKEKFNEVKYLNFEN